MLDKVVHGVQILAVVVVAAFVILLFVNEPAQPAPVPKAGTANAGAAIYATRCASCHGDDGGGSFGPALGGGVVVGRFPDPNDQIAVVTKGRGIDAVVRRQPDARADRGRGRLHAQRPRLTGGDLRRRGACGCGVRRAKG